MPEGQKVKVIIGTEHSRTSGRLLPSKRQSQVTFAHPYSTKPVAGKMVQLIKYFKYEPCENEDPRAHLLPLHWGGRVIWIYRIYMLACQYS